MKKGKEKASSVWLVSEAKSRLSEVLRRAKKKGPQVIGTRDQFVVVPREEWEAKSRSAKPLSQWLLENSPKVDFKVPERGGSPSRTIPFSGS